IGLPSRDYHSKVDVPSLEVSCHAHREPVKFLLSLRGSGLCLSDFEGRVRPVSSGSSSCTLLSANVPKSPALYYPSIPSHPSTFLPSLPLRSDSIPAAVGVPPESSMINAATSSVSQTSYFPNYARRRPGVIVLSAGRSYTYWRDKELC
ncbi:unnamed protein product, partial [Protopolystoma xenopodis]